MNKSRTASLDLYMLGASLILGVLSLFSLFPVHTSREIFIRQGVWLCISVILFFLVQKIDVHIFSHRKTILWLYSIGIGILALLGILGGVSKGAQSWFKLGFASFQPTDFVKVSLICILALYFSKRHIEIARARHLIVSLVYALIPTGLLLLQPDFGSAIMLLGIWFGMMLFSGLPLKKIAALLCVGIVLCAGLWFGVFKEYQKNRVLTFLNPGRDVTGSGYNVHQALIAVGSGQWTGKGVGLGTQSRLAYLPEHHTDFIFASFAEEWGFAGSSLVLVLYGFICICILKIAERAETMFETFICIGAVSFFMVHILVNIGMNIGIMPVTGITLPFMSYGGSHLVAEYVLLGIIAGIDGRKRQVARDSGREIVIE